LNSIAQVDKPKRACALPGPASTCTKLEANGDITLTWTIPTDPLSVFVRYEIYRIGTVGPILSIPTFTNQNSATINAFFASSKFYIGIVSLCGGVEVLNYGDTVQAINLSLNNPKDGRAELIWNSLNDSLKVNYQVKRQHPTYGWSLRDSLDYLHTNYIDTIDVCAAFLNYQVVVQQNGCASYSNILGDNFKDIITPTIPIIKSVSYDTLKKGVIVSWYKNPARDVQGYLLKIAYDDSPLAFLDSVESKKHIEPLSYNLVNASLNSAITFSISAYDSCLSSSPPNNQLSGNSQPHIGFNLKNTYDLCNRIIQLNWTKYIGWTDITKYKIYYKKGNEFWKLLDSTTNQNYSDTLEGFVNYSFIVEAIGSNGEKAFSNPIKYYTKAPSLPAYNYIKSANVNDKYIQITQLIDNVTGVKKVILEKKNKEGKFVEIQTKTANSSVMIFNDSMVETPFESYAYRIRIVDSCGNKTTYSNEVTSMLLKVENKISDSTTLNNTITWSPYIGFNGSILNYAIYRKLKGVFDPNPIAIVPNTQLNYTDNLLNVPNFTGQVCYYVVAVESDNIYKQPTEAYSNTVCVTFEPLVFIPNAFTPNGKNPIFYPVISMFEPKDYSLTIMNRWGQPVFRSLDYKIGWDGMFGNEMSQNGNYMYVIRYLDGDGKEYIEHGFVTLIK
jgi:gliding motility-associated-like protein